VTEQSSQPDFFDRARRVAVAGMIAAGAAGAIGSFLDWVTITRLPGTVPDDQAPRAQPASGVDAGDGWWVFLLAVVMINAALALWIRRTSVWAWIGFLASVVIGGIAIADYRAVGRPTSELLRDLDLIGDLDRGIGLLLVLAAGLLGVIFSLVGVAASPYRRP
jgi:hypothetical protein